MAFDYTKLSYIERINKVVDYINLNLSSSLVAKELCKRASFSEFHFQRIFKMVVGESLNSFIKRKRIEKAASWLVINRHLSVTEIALSLGFSSSANFAKAFKQHFKTSPSQYRLNYPISKGMVRPEESEIIISRDGKLIRTDGKTNSKDGKAEFNSFWNDDLTLNQKELIKAMNVEVKELESKHVAYVRIFSGYQHKDILEAWEKLMNWAEPRGFLNEFTEGYGITYDDPDLVGYDKCQYDACITIPEEITDFDGNIGVQDIPSGKYVIYTFTGNAMDNNVVSDGFFNIYVWIALHQLEIDDYPSLMALSEDPSQVPDGIVEMKLFVKINN